MFAESRLRQLVRLVVAFVWTEGRRAHGKASGAGSEQRPQFMRDSYGKMVTLDVKSKKERVESSMRARYDNAWTTWGEAPVQRERVTALAVVRAGPDTDGDYIPSGDDGKVGRSVGRTGSSGSGG